MNCPQPSRRPSRCANHDDASTDVPSWLNRLIWWLSKVTTTSSCGIAVDLSDGDVLAVCAVAVVPDAVEVRVRGVVPGPSGGDVAGRVEDEDLRARVRGVGGGGHHLDPAVAVEVAGRQPAGLGTLPAAARRGAPLDAHAARRTPRPCPRCRRPRSPWRRRRRGRRPRRARRPALRSPCPCPAGARGGRRRTCCRRARRSPACGRRRGRRAPGTRTIRSRRCRCCARSAAPRRRRCRPTRARRRAGSAPPACRQRRESLT